MRFVIESVIADVFQPNTGEWLEEGLVSFPVKEPPRSSSELCWLAEMAQPADTHWNVMGYWLGITLPAYMVPKICGSYSCEVQYTITYTHTIYTHMIYMVYILTCMCCRVYHSTYIFIIVIIYQYNVYIYSNSAPGMIEISCILLQIVNWCW